MVYWSGHLPSERSGISSNSIEVKLKNQKPATCSESCGSSYPAQLPSLQLVNSVGMLRIRIGNCLELGLAKASSIGARHESNVSPIKITSQHCHGHPKCLVTSLTLGIKIRIDKRFPKGGIYFPIAQKAARYMPCLVIEP